MSTRYHDYSPTSPAPSATFTPVTSPRSGSPVVARCGSGKTTFYTPLLRRSRSGSPVNPASPLSPNYRPTSPTYVQRAVQALGAKRKRSCDEGCEEEMGAVLAKYDVTFGTKMFRKVVQSESDGSPKMKNFEAYQDYVLKFGEGGLEQTECLDTIGDMIEFIRQQQGLLTKQWKLIKESHETAKELDSAVEVVELQKGVIQKQNGVIQKQKEMMELQEERES